MLTGYAWWKQYNQEMTSFMAQSRGSHASCKGRLAPAAWGTREALYCLCTAPPAYSPTLRKQFATLPCSETSQQAALLTNLAALPWFPYLQIKKEKKKKNQQNQHSISSVEINCQTLATAYSTIARRACWRQAVTTQEATGTSEQS